MSAGINNKRKQPKKRASATGSVVARSAKGPRDPEAAERRRKLKQEQQRSATRPTGQRHSSANHSNGVNAGRRADSSRRTDAGGRADASRRSSVNAIRKNTAKAAWLPKLLLGLLLALVVIVIAIFIAKQIGGADDITQSRLTLNADGSLVMEEVAYFDKYDDTSDLKDYTKALVDDYNVGHGQERISIEKLNVKKDRAYLKTVYKDYVDYADFTGYWTTAATLPEAREMGYDFFAVFNEVNEDASLGNQVDAKEFLSNDTLKVFILKENVEIKVPGSIKYVSDGNVQIIDANTVAVEPIEDVQEATHLVYVIYE